MTLYDLSLEYEKTAHGIKQRLKELKKQALLSQSDPDKDLLSRITILTAEYQHLIKTADYLKGYYRK